MGILNDEESVHIVANTTHDMTQLVKSRPTMSCIHQVYVRLHCVHVCMYVCMYVHSHLTCGLWFTSQFLGTHIVHQ